MSKEGLDDVTRRVFLKVSGNVAKTSTAATAFYRTGALASLFGLVGSGCTGSFHLVKLNHPVTYDDYNSNKDIRHIRFAFLNAADLRGNVSNLFQIVPRSKIRRRARWLANKLNEEGVDILALSEVDYKGTSKTGGYHQPKLIAQYMGSPYDYVIYDQYFKSPYWTTGNAVISRFPLKAIHRHIYDKKYSIFGRLRHLFKDFIHVGAKVGKRELDIIVNHLHHAEEYVRMGEAKDIMKYLAKLKNEDPKRFIVAPGDYNSKGDSKPIKYILSKKIIFPPKKNFRLKTFRPHDLKKDLDHIFASSNLEMTNYRTFDYPWSDHLGLICDLEFKY